LLRSGKHLGGVRVKKKKPVRGFVKREQESQHERESS
jgi:hypothetical protein